VAFGGAAELARPCTPRTPRDHRDVRAGALRRRDWLWRRQRGAGVVCQQGCVRPHMWEAARRQGRRRLRGDVRRSRHIGPGACGGAPHTTRRSPLSRAGLALGRPRRRERSGVPQRAVGVVVSVAAGPADDWGLRRRVVVGASPPSACSLQMVLGGGAQRARDQDDGRRPRAAAT